MAEKKPYHNIINSVLQSVLENTTDIVFVKGLDFVYLGASKPFVQMVGKDSVKEVVGKTDQELFDDEGLTECYHKNDQFVMEQGVPRIDYEEPLPGINGKPRYGLVSKYPIMGKDGKAVGVLGIAREVTHEYEASRDYQKELDYLLDLQGDVRTAFLFDLTEWRIVAVRNQDKANSIISDCHTIEDYLKNAANCVADSEEARSFFRSFSKENMLKWYESGKRELKLEYLRRMPDGKERWVQNEIRFLTDPVTRHISIVFILRDIDEIKRAEKELERAAEYDAMTGLLNRNSTMKRIGNFLAQDGAAGTHALFMIDIDNFKTINDTFGHQKGDEVLVEVASSIRHSFRDTDIVGRIGGDEFFVLMKNIMDIKTARRKARELIEALQYVCPTSCIAFELSGSVGISLYEASGKTLDELYAEADAALYKAKSAGKNRFAFSFDDDAPQEPENLETGFNSPVNLQALMENMDGALLVVEITEDEEIRVIYANNSIFRGVVFTGQRERKNAFINLIVKEDLDGFREALLSAARDKTVLDYDYRIYGEKDEVLWRHARGTCLPDSNYGIQRMLIVASDITKIKKNEEKLAFAELRYRTAIEQSDLLLWAVDLRTKELVFSGPGAQLLGCGGKTYYDPLYSRIENGAIHPDFITEFRRMYEDIYAGRESGEYTIVTIGENGMEYPGRACYQLLKDSQNKPYYAIGTTVPLMKEQELELYRTMEHGGVFSVRIDEDFTLIYGNDRYYAIHGYTRKSMLVKLANKCKAYIHPEDLPAVRIRINETLDEGKTTAMWFMRIITEDGEIKHTQVSGEFRKQQDGSYLMNGVVIDITDRKLPTLALEKQKAGLKERYDNMLYLRENPGKNIIASAYLDLTANSCHDCRSCYEKIREEVNSDTADGYFAAVSRQQADPAQTSVYERRFNREALITRFEAGVSQVSCEYRIWVGSEDAIWVRSNILMIRNPQTEHVEGLVYAVDINAEKNIQFTVDRLLDIDYEFIGQINAQTGEIVTFGSSDTGSLQPACSLRSYDAELPIVLENMVLGGYYEEALRALSRKHIVKALTKMDVYTCAFPTRQGENSGQRRKQWKCCWLDKAHSYILITRTDITGLFAAETDPLTGLYNRQAFYRHVREEIDAHHDKKYVLLRFDIDRFKAYNDVFGMEAGDQLLSVIGHAMLAAAEKHFVLGRVQADHFVALLPEEKLNLESVQKSLDNYSSAYSANFHLTFSVGLYRVTEPEIEVSLMCDRALLALQAVKSSYNNKKAWYTEQMRKKLIEEQGLIDDMDQALKEGQFVLYFQPQVNFDDGSLIGAEALVRWDHPKHGLISPANFIPIFEKNGFISKLDAYVWEKSCQYLRSWLDRDHRILPLSVSVNISRINIYDDTLCDRLKALVEKYRLPPSYLKLEITESAYMENPTQLINVVKRLQAMGFTIEMDDFGSGYSSLNTLKDVPVDVLKLDIKFLSQGENDARGGHILSSVIRMAHWLKIPVIAEGVETKTQADYLKSLSCFYMQGYYFGKPMPALQFEELLKKKALGPINSYNSVDLEGIAAFWDPSAQTALIFNSFVGGAAILEYNNNTAEILRANDEFYAQLRTTREAYLEKQRSTLTRFEEEYKDVFVQMLETAIKTGGEAECEVKSLPLAKGDKTFWTRNRVRLLAKNGNSALFYILTENVTDKKELAEKLRVSQDAMQFAMAQEGRIVCDYSHKDRTLIIPEEYAKKHGLPVSIAMSSYNRKQIVPEDRPRFVALCRKIHRGSKNGSALIRIFDANGSYDWQQIRFVTIFADGGAPVRTIITIEDVSAEKEREIENQRNRLLIEKTGVCMFDYDLLTGSLRFQTYEKGRGIYTISIPDYYNYINTDESRVHPDSKEMLRAWVLSLRSDESLTGSFDYVADNWGDGYQWSRIYYIKIMDENGILNRVIGQIDNIQKEKDNEALFTEMNERLGKKAVGESYNSVLLEHVLSHLYHSKDMESAIWQVLETLGRFYDVSRVYIFEDIENHACCRNTIEWCAPGVHPEIQNLQRLSYQEDLGNMYHKTLNENGVLYCTDISLLPKKMYQILAPQGIKSMLHCAILDNGVFCGYIGFDDCHENRVWTEEQVATLTLVSKLIGAFLIKEHKDEEAAFSADFQAALDDNEAFIYIIDPETYEISYNNKKIQNYFGSSFEGKYCYREFLKRDQPCEKCPVARLREEGITEAMEIMRPDGLLVLTQASPLRRNGRDLVMVSSIDMSDVSKIRETLHKKEASMQALYNAIPCGVIQYKKQNGKWSVVDFNRFAWEALGYASGEEYTRAVRNGVFEERIYPEDQNKALHALHKALRDGDLISFIPRVIGKDGKIRHMHTTLQKVVFPGGNIQIQVIFYQIGEQET
ncbi:MAG: EAL domain-containing protein [Christensenella sp.]|nr:EAL domain-containing protein [Christensenella sp.]